MKPVLERAFHQVASSFGERLSAEAPHWISITSDSITKQCNGGQNIKTQPSKSEISIGPEVSLRNPKSKSHWSVSSASVGQFFGSTGVGNFWGDSRVKSFKQLVRGSKSPYGTTRTKQLDLSNPMPEDGKDDAATPDDIKPKHELLGSAILEDSEPIDINVSFSGDSVCVEMLDLILAELEDGKNETVTTEKEKQLMASSFNHHPSNVNSLKLLIPLELEEDKSRAVEGPEDILKAEERKSSFSGTRELPPITLSNVSIAEKNCSAKSSQSTAFNTADHNVEMDAESFEQIEDLLISMKTEAKAKEDKSSSGKEPERLNLPMNSIVPSLIDSGNRRLPHGAQDMTERNVVHGSIEEERTLNVDTFPSCVDQQVSSVRLPAASAHRDSDESGNSSPYNEVTRCDRFLLDCIWLLDTILLSTGEDRRQQQDDSENSVPSLLYSTVASCTISAFSDMIDILLRFDSQGRVLHVNEMLGTTEEFALLSGSRAFHQLIFFIVRFHMKSSQSLLEAVQQNSMDFVPPIG